MSVLRRVLLVINVAMIVYLVCVISRIDGATAMRASDLQGSVQIELVPVEPSREAGSFGRSRETQI